MDETIKQGKGALRLLLATMLAAMLIPWAPRAAWADENEAAAQTQTSEIADLLAAGDYVEGEALVVVDNAASRNSLRSRSVDPLSSAEPLMDASAETYATATGVDVPLEQSVSNGPVLLRSARSLPEDDAVSMVLVRQEGTSTKDLLRQLQDDPRILSAEPNYVQRLDDPDQTALDESTPQVAAALGLDSSDAAPSAPASADASGTAAADLSGYQWGCRNTGEVMVQEEAPPLAGFDIAPPNWNQVGTTNAADVVAVVDTGVDYNHPDLNGIMCDMTQYTDRGGRYGINVVPGMDPTDPMDDHYHGTHCAGIIASQWDGVGTSGVASGVQLVAVRVAGRQNTIESADTIRAYEYLAEAVDAGLPLRAINNSWAGRTMSKAFSLAATKLGEKGAVTVIGSGNDAADVDKIPMTASVLAHNPYAVAVDASDSSGQLASFSNYGVETTDVVAPGMNIMSTVPLGRAAYAPEADGSPLSYETFESDAPSVTARATPTSSEDIDAVVQGATHFDARGGALKIPFSEMLTEETALGISFRSVVVSMEVDPSNQEDVRYVGMNATTTNQNNDNLLYQVAIMKDGVLDWTPVGPTAVAILGKDRGWTTIAFDAQALAQNAGGTLAFEGDKLQVRLTFARAGTPIAPTDALYLDTVGTGRAGSAIPYQSLSGTSMATPMVTGAAMVLAQDVDGSTPAERAAKLAALVKASVRPVDAFSGKCSSGGHLDLRVASGDFVPVVSGARMESDGDAALVMVEGSYFGAAQGAGSVHIGGKEAAVRSWSDGSIVTECPQGLKSGVLVVEVTAGNGKSGSKGFLLQVPERPDDQSTPLFEKTIALPTSDEGLPVGVSYGLLTGLGGSLYLLPNDFSISHAGTYALWRYDPDRDSWTQCADLPEALSSASMTVFDGKLYVYGEAGETDGALAPRLVSYDPATNAWTSHDASRLPFHATIVNCDGAMLLVGGAAYDGAKWVELTEGNIAVYDTQTGAVTAAGSLATGRSTPFVVARGAELFVALGDVHDVTGSSTTSPVFERIVRSGDSYVGNDLSAALPALAPGYDDSFGLAAVKAGVVLSGRISVEEADGGRELDQDTYLLDLANGDKSFQGIDKRASRVPLYFPSSTAYDGWLYTMGFSVYENGGRVIRATPMETLPQPGDLPEPGPGPTPGPGPAAAPEPVVGKGDATSLARTGDPLGAFVPAITLAAGVMLASIGVATAARRKAKKNRL